MSGSMRVDDGSYSFRIFGVKGATSCGSGQSVRPVSFAREEGNGSVMFAPLLGYLKEVTSVGASSWARIWLTTESNTKLLENISKYRNGKQNNI